MNRHGGIQTDRQARVHLYMEWPGQAIEQTRKHTDRQTDKDPLINGMAWISYRTDTEQTDRQIEIHLDTYRPMIVQAAIRWHFTQSSNMI